MDDSYYDIAFGMIMHAGDSKAESMLATQAAREFNFKKAQEHLKAANEKLIEAHNIQTSMLQQEASGGQVKVDIIMVHAQDHLTTAIIMKDQAEEFIKLYELIETLIKK